MVHNLGESAEPVPHPSVGLLACNFAKCPKPSKNKQKEKKRTAEMTAPLLGRFKYVPPTPHPPTHKYTTKSNLSLPLSPLFCHVPTLEAVTPSKQIWTWQPYFGHQDLMGVFNFKSNSSRLIHVVHVKVQIMGFHMSSFHAQQFLIQFNTN